MDTVWQIRQSSLDGIGGGVKAGVLVGRDGLAKLKHYQRVLDNHRCSFVYTQGAILDETSFLCFSIVLKHRFDKFYALRLCENIVAAKLKL